MSNFRKKISISQLRPGMYVEDVFNEKGLLLFCADIMTNGYHQIESLRKQGASYLFVNVQKSREIIKHVKEYKNTDSIEEKNSFQKVIVEDANDMLSNYEKKLKLAFCVRQKAVQTVQNLLMDIKTGRIITMQAIADTVEDMVEQVLEDPDVYFRICQLKKHSYDTYVHSVNVSVLMAGLASAMGYPKDKIIEACIGGLLHDIGKIKISKYILKKNVAYTAQEQELIRRHPMTGIDILKNISLKISDSSYRIVAQHHERSNGTGYPLKLKGKQIDEFAMICAISDTYDTLTSDVGYRKSCLPQEALALIFQGSDEEYPRFIVEHFTKMLGIYPIGSFVKLLSQEMGIVVKVNKTSLLTPQVVILFDANCKKIQTPFIRNLSEFAENENWKIECCLNPENYQVNSDEYVKSMY